MTTGADPREAADPAQPAPERRPATLLEVAGAVFWSFFGVRKGAHMRRDAVTLKPHQVVLVGLISGIVFVLALIVLVHVILKSAGVS